MATLADSATAARAMWEQLSRSQRMLVATSALVVIAGGATLTTLWKSAQMRPLYTNLSVEDAGVIVARLKELKIPFELAAGGTTVEVPTERVDELHLMLASDGMPTSGSLGFELFDRSQLGMTSFTEDVNLRRALEGELARTVRGMREIEQARVHVVLKRRSGFGLDRDTSKASVAVKEQTGRRLEPRNVRAIQELVAYAVDGLEPDSVVVVNYGGELLSTRAGDPSLRPESADLAERQRIERALESSVTTLLEPLYGPDEVSVRVAAEVDFSAVEERAELVLPEQKTVISEHLTHELGEGSQAIGVPGVRSNVDPGTTPGNRARAQGDEPRRSSETRNFEVSKTVRHTTSPEWVVRRLSVAVLINEPAAAEGEAAGERAAAADRVSSLVEAAVGLDSARGDRVQVDFLPFAAPAVTEASYLDSARTLGLPWARPLLIALLALVGYVTFIKPLKQQTLQALRASTVQALPPAPAGAHGGGGGRAARTGATVAEQVMDREDNGHQDPMAAPTSIITLELRDAVAQAAASDPAAAARFIKGWLVEKT